MERGHVRPSAGDSLHLSALELILELIMDQKTEAKVDHLIAELWRKNLPSLRDRLDMLDRAAAEAASGKLTEATRAEAQSIAHKLAGNLGMFGYPKGSEVASKMEHALKTPTPETLLTLTELAKQLRQTLPGL